MSTYKDYLIEIQNATQVGYGPKERKMKGGDLRKDDFYRKRQIRTCIVTEPDGHQRVFNTKRDAIKWIDENG